MTETSNRPHVRSESGPVEAGWPPVAAKITPELWPEMRASR